MRRSPFIPAFPDLPDEMPVFPLSGAVVMPGVQLPLNIFEPRYLSMIQAALATDHMIAMVQPANDADEPTLHRIGCAGRITSYSETNDGRIIMVLTGICRFAVAEELSPVDGYRRVRPNWQGFESDYQDDDAALPERDRFLSSLRNFCDQRGVEVPWDDLEKMADGELVNLLCAHLPLVADDKQALIETVNLTERAQLMRGLMDMSALASGGIAAEQRH